MLDTPIGLSVFNRPDLTELVFQAIAQARPKRLFVFADGPRSPDEEELCARARAVAAKVDWNCDVKHDFSEANLGARRRYASGVDWIFSQVDEAIIFDDDCVPDPTFFPFCEAMLEHYRDDTRVMMVTGSNYLERWKEDRQSYHFSYFGSPWGWATWKRAWKFYDITMAAWGDEEVKARIRDLIADEEIFAFQARRFDRLYAEPGDRHSWDLPWSFARLMQGGLTVVPAVNLISNLGNMDGRGVPPAHPLASLRTAPLPFPLRFQSAVAVDRLYDKQHVRRIYEWFMRPAAGRSSPPTPRPSSAGQMVRFRAMRRLRTFGKYASQRGLGWVLLYSVRKISKWAVVELDKRLVRLEKQRRITGSNTVSSRYHTVRENVAIWDSWDWSSRGEEWTDDVRRYRGIDPAVWKVRLVDELIVGRVTQGSVVLEIGPGAGRWSEFLHQRAGLLILADISSKCLEICRERFDGDPRVELHRITDGTLPFVGDGVVDVVWSYDVFVHINPEDTDRYLREIRRILRSGGTAVIHHPGTYASYDAHTEAFRSHVTAQLFADMASRHGLTVVEQDRSLGHMPGDIVSILSKK